MEEVWLVGIQPWFEYTISCRFTTNVPKHFSEQRELQRDSKIKEAMVTINSILPSALRESIAEGELDRFCTRVDVGINWLNGMICNPESTTPEGSKRLSADYVGASYRSWEALSRFPAWQRVSWPGWLASRHFVTTHRVSGRDGPIYFEVLCPRVHFCACRVLYRSWECGSLCATGTRRILERTRVLSYRPPPPYAAPQMQSQAHWLT